MFGSKRILLLLVQINLFLGFLLEASREELSSQHLLRVEQNLADGLMWNRDGKHHNLGLDVANLAPN